MWLLLLAYIGIAVLMASQRRMRRELEEAMAAVAVLGERLNAFERSTFRAAEPEPARAPSHEPPPAAAPPPVPEPPAPEPAAFETGTIAPAWETGAPSPAGPRIPAPPPLPAFAAVREQPPAPARSLNWEELIGGNILNKLGALVLAIGIALFLSYSFARMGPMGRALTGLGVSGAILTGGLALERKETYRVFSRGLVAAGWAGLYFTTYAMYAIEAARVIANPLAGTLLMLAAAGAMVAHTLRYRVQSLSTLAYGCVFAALALSESNTFVAVALLPLAASMLYLGRRFHWNWLALFSAAATYVTFLSRPASGAPLWAVQAMLLMFWLLFETFDLLQTRAAQPSRRDPLLFGVNALAGLGASAALWYRMAPDQMWQFCAAGSILYLISTWVRFPLGAKSQWDAALVLSVALAALGIFDGVEGLWASLAYIALAETVFLASLRVRHVLVRVLSLAAFGLAAAEIASRAVDDSWRVPVAVLGAVFYLNRYAAPAARYFGFLASACVSLLLTELPSRWIGLALVLFGAALFELGLWRRLADFRWQAYAAWALETIALPTRWFAAAAGLVLLAQAIRSSRWMGDLEDRERQWLQAGAALASGLLWLLSASLFPADFEPAGCAAIALAVGEIGVTLGIPALAWQARGLSVLVSAAIVVDQGTAPRLTNGLAQAALQWWLWRRSRERFHGRIHGWLAVAGLVWMIAIVGRDHYILWWTVLGAGLTIAARLLGVRDLRWHASALGLLTALAAALENEVLDPACVVAWFLLALVLEPRNYLRPAYAMGAALLGAISIERGVTGPMLTLGWSLEGIALLAFGFPARERALRLSGLALLLGCIAKVFLYDLSSLETMYRILSFIGLGAVLIAVSFIYTRFRHQLRRYL